MDIFNRSYRILWSASRRQWVVADERAGTLGKGRSRGGLSRLVCAALVAAGLLAGAPEGASALTAPCGTGTSVNISAALNGTCSATGTDSITLTNTGSITPALSASAIRVVAPATGVQIINAGTLKGRGLSWPAIHVNPTAGAVTGTAITNQAGGLISQTVRGTAIQFASGMDAGSSLNNSGTIHATAKTTTNFATAISIQGNMAGTLTNGGTISAQDKISVSSLTARARGINVTGDISGTLTNSGTVSAVAIENSSPRSTAVATGILAANLSGTLTVTSTGTVSASAFMNSTQSSQAKASGINITTALNGSLTNNGTVAVNATASGSTAIARGVRVGSIGAGATLSNTGVIQVGAKGSSATATGIRVTGTISGSLSNSGNVVVKATAGGGSADGIRAGAVAAGASLSNAGTILVSQATGGIRNMRGINVGVLNGSLTNSGSVTVNLNQSTSRALNATGILTTMMTGSSLTNSGTVTVTARSAAGRATVMGMDIVAAFGGGGGTLTLSAGSAVKAMATAGGTSIASAVGVSAGMPVALGSTLTNNGLIQAKARESSSAWGGVAVGLMVTAAPVDGTLTNTGTIQATVTAGSGFGIIQATGVQVSTLNGTLSNSGTITASAIRPTSSTGQRAIGVSITTMGAGSVLNNSGTISATTNAGAFRTFSLQILGGAGTINNQTGGVLRGGINIGGTVVVNNAGTIDIPDAAQAIILTSLNNQAGGVLRIGTTTLTTAGVQNAGTVEVPDGKNAQILGNLTQLAGGVLRIGASSAASYGKLAVTGTADLSASGAFDVNVAGVNTLANGDVLTGVLTAGTLVAPATYVVTDNSLLFDFTAATNALGNGVDLTVVAAAGGGGGAGGGAGGPNTVLGSVLATGFTPGIGAAKVFDALIAGGATGDMANVITALGKLSTQQQVSAAVERTVPLLTGGAQLAGLDVARGIGRELESHLMSVAGMASGDSFFGSGKLWIKPFGGMARQRDRNGASGFDANNYGLIAGLDKDFSDTASMSGAFGWSRSFIDSNNGIHSADVNAFNLALSGLYRPLAGTYVRISANGGINRTVGQRRIVFGGLNRVADSRYNSWTAHAGIEAGHAFAAGEGLTLTPSLRADYAMIHDNAYTETGAGALNLIVGSRTLDELLLGGDVRLAWVLSETSTFSVSVGGAYDALHGQALITSAFAGASGATFVTTGINPPRWLGRGNASLKFNLDDGTDVVAAYDGEFRRDFRNQTGSVKLVMTF